MKTKHSETKATAGFLSSEGAWFSVGDPEEKKFRGRGLRHFATQELV